MVFYMRVKGNKIFSHFQVSADGYDMRGHKMTENINALFNGNVDENYMVVCNCVLPEVLCCNMLNMRVNLIHFQTNQLIYC